MAEDFARELAKVAVGQIADLAGYEQTHRNALEAVADVLVRYIRDIGLYSKEYAELQNRTDVSAPDVVRCRNTHDTYIGWCRVRTVCVCLRL